MTPGEKTKIRNRLVKNAEYVFNLPHFLIALAVLLAVAATFDFFDGLGSLWPILPTGLFYRDEPGVYFDFIGNTLLLLAFAAALLGNREARRNTSFELRPYLRVAWISKPEPNDRQGQGIRNTCLVLVNNGNGLMRNVRYKVWASGKEVPVRNHSLITKDGTPTKVVYAKGFMGATLGDRDSVSPENESKNDEIVQAERLAIVGTYEDVDGHTFDFSFESDSSQQSWFREMDFQHPRTLIRKIVRWLMKKI
jgi:hypothetical protein